MAAPQGGDGLGGKGDSSPGNALTNGAQSHSLNMVGRVRCWEKSPSIMQDQAGSAPDPGASQGI